jgi:DNA-binding NarL/FixJ family response regulator
MLRILIADDDAEVRSALRILLKAQPDLAVVGEAANALDLLEQIETEQPAVVILDWGLIDLAPDIRADLRERYPALRVIVMSGRPEARSAALAAGAVAFVSKGDPPDRLLTTLNLLRDRSTDTRQ